MKSRLIAGVAAVLMLGTAFATHAASVSYTLYITAGSVTVNAGAAAALLEPNHLASLLPVGISRVDGPFEAGDVIQIRDEGGRVIGCGKARYNHTEAAEKLGQRGHKPLVHYDYLYLVETAGN